MLKIVVDCFGVVYGVVQIPSTACMSYGNCAQRHLLPVLKVCEHDCCMFEFSTTVAYDVRMIHRCSIGPESLCFERRKPLLTALPAPGGGQSSRISSYTRPTHQQHHSCASMLFFIQEGTQYRPRMCFHQCSQFHNPPASNLKFSFARRIMPRNR